MVGRCDINSRAPNLSRVFAFALIGYGAVGLPGTFFTAKQLVDLFVNWSNTRTTWLFVGEAFRVFTVWAALGFGFLVLRRPRALESALVFMGICTFADGLCLCLARYQGLSYLTIFPHISFFSSFLAVPAGIFVAAFAVWKSKPILQSAQQSLIACNQCGCDMRSLIEPRCPECGRVYTLDEFHKL